MYMAIGPGMPALGAGLGPPPRPDLKKAVRGSRRLIGSVLGGLVLVLGCARPLTLTLGTACYTRIHLHCVYIHLHLDVPVNKHVESALAEDVMDNEVAGPRSLLTAPRGVLPASCRHHLCPQHSVT